MILQNLYQKKVINCWPTINFVNIISNLIYISSLIIFKLLSGLTNQWCMIIRVTKSKSGVQRYQGIHPPNQMKHLRGATSFCITGYYYQLPYGEPTAHLLIILTFSFDKNPSKLFSFPSYFSFAFCIFKLLFTQYYTTIFSLYPF